MKRARRGRARGCPRGARCRKARQANFGSVRGGAGCGVPRELTAAARPARPIKRICSVRGAVGARGFPQRAGLRKTRQANFGSAAGGAGCGVARRVGAAAKPPGGSMILPYRGKGNFLIKGGPCGVVDVSLPAASPFMRRVLSPEPVGGGSVTLPQRKKYRTAT